MIKEVLIGKLNQIKDTLTNQKKQLSRLTGNFVSRKDIRDASKELAKEWFEKIEGTLKGIYDFKDDVLIKYHEYFEELLRLGLASNSRKNTYIKVTEKILSNFQDDLLIPVIKKSSLSKRIEDLNVILEQVSTEEKDYLTESIKCAEFGFFRASIVLAWCAAVNRMHKLIEKRGLKEFNDSVKKMVEITEGRYKRFSTKYTLYSVSEIKTVFDTHLLWVLEYLEIIDPNQHDRLELCFTMRNNCAHPGDAPITEPNLVSFFSDINYIIFKNENFKL